MKLKVTECNIERLTESEAFDLRNEINKISGGNLVFKPDEYPQLLKLYKLIDGAFNSSKEGVHFIHNSKED